MRPPGSPEAPGRGKSLACHEWLARTVLIGKASGMGEAPHFVLSCICAVVLSFGFGPQVPNGPQAEACGSVGANEDQSEPWASLELQLFKR